MTTEPEKNPKFPKRVKNATISGIFIGFNEDNILTSWLVLNFGKHEQGFGGLAFSLKDPQSAQVTYSNSCAAFIANLLNVIGVQQINDLANKAVRVYHDDKKIYCLGNYLQDKWFNIDTLKIYEREHPDGISVTTDDDGFKHHTLEVDSGQIGTELNKN